MKKFNAHSDMPVMSRDEVRAVDIWAINTLGIPGVVLMENAGRSCGEFVQQQLGAASKKQVWIFCGTGNNGGDGFVIARHLMNAGVPAKVFICGDPEKIKGDALINYNVLQNIKADVSVIDLSNDLAAQFANFAKQETIIVDALFGTGLQGDLKPQYQRLIDFINGLGGVTIAVDIPSGLDCDSGAVLGAAIKATATITFVAVKKGFLNVHAAQYTGEIYVTSIGVEPAV